MSNALANLALPLVSIITGPLLARTLGVDGRGVVAAVVAPLVLAAWVFQLGMTDALVYFVARREVSLRSAIRIACEAGAVLGVVAAATVALIAPLLLRDAPESITLVRMLSLSLPLVLIAVFLRSVVQGRERFNILVRERVALALGRLVLLVLLAVAGVLTVVTASVVTALVPLAAALALAPALRLRPAEREVSGPASAPSLQQSRRRALSYGLRSGVGHTAGALTQRLDQVLLAPLAGVAELGLYVVAVALAEIPLFAINAVSDIIYARSTAQDDPAMLARALRCLTVVAVPTAAVGIATTPVLLPLLFGRDFAAAVPLAQLLFLGSMVAGSRLLLTTGLLSLGRPGLRSVIQISGVVLTAVGLVVLIPPYGALGAATAMLISQVLTAAAYLMVFSRLSGIAIRVCLVPQKKDFRDVWQLARQRLRPLLPLRRTQQAPSGEDVDA